LTDEAHALRNGTFEESDETLFTELPPGLRVISVTCAAVTSSGIETTVSCDGANLIVNSEDNRIHVRIDQ
jgi:hypothetical protein